MGVPSRIQAFPMVRTPVRRENNMYIFSGNATIFEKTFNSGHFWVAQNDFGGRTLGRRQQDLGTLWLSGRLDD